MKIVHTPILIDYIEVVEHALSLGKKWNMGFNDDRYDVLEKYWFRYNEHTVICVGNIYIKYGHIGYYISEGFEVTSSDIFLDRNYKNILMWFI